MTDPRRGLPSVDRLLNDPAVAALLELVPRDTVVRAIRRVLETARRRRTTRPIDWADAIAEEVQRASQRTLRPVINATGVVLHTNIGRAPLARAAIEAIVSVSSGYSTLEYDLSTGSRGRRTDHTRRLLGELSGGEDALVVNNAAGALVLSLNALAEGHRVLISRGELIEIGGSFRIPDIIARSGCILQEVGTTNRTHLGDYEAALEGAAAILTVHRSNFTQAGFVASPAAAELAALARSRRIPYIHDVGSGLLADLAPWGLTGEPRIPDAIAEGADLVIFSGDKLLGGPQAGCLVGRETAVAACARSPLARAFRADKLTLAGLEATLQLYRNPAVALGEIPTLAMLTASPAILAARAAAIAARLPSVLAPVLESGDSAVGGGAFPVAKLATTLIRLSPGDLGAAGLALRLRLGDPPVILRVTDEHLLLDPRTIASAEEAPLIGAFASAISV
jgi:L-seryl-tRNA(Ser) seleniumtransferase